FSVESIFSQKIIWKNTVVPYQNDSVILYLQNPRGTIQWEVSADKTNWASLPGKTSESLMFHVDSSAYYRAKITEGTCNVIYSDTIFIAEVYDARTGQVYEAVKIGSDYWMAENLDFYTPEGSYYYNNDSVNHSIYGRLYSWETALDACPAGWHLPTEKEWQNLEIAMGIDAIEVLNTGWRGTDEAFQLFVDGEADFNIFIWRSKVSKRIFTDDSLVLHSGLRKNMTMRKLITVDLT
ncbi:MAG: hypothetical protein HC905_15915, partial [Bacteroidales bacterium]|nr:hypothetical protein [Bacteroidales bacterium]